MVERFGRFWLQEELGGRGGIELYRATLGADPNTYAFDFGLARASAERVATPAAVDACVAQFEVGKQLSHPNLVRVFEVGAIEGRPYVVVEHLPGVSLAALMQELDEDGTTFPVDLALFVSQQLLRALDYLHRARGADGRPLELIHGHVTPQNVRLSTAGVVKLTDPGLTRAMDEERAAGDAAYLAPEALAGQLGDQRVDLWGVSAILYQLVTGEPPYGLSDDEELLAGRVPRIESAQRVAPQVDGDLSKLLAKALSPKLRKRPKEAVNLYRLLRGYRLSQGIHVDGAALGAFVRQTLGAEPQQEFFALPEEQEFAEPAWQVPVQRSLTQRIQLVQRRRVRLYWFAVAAGLGVLLALLVSLARGGCGEAPPSAATSPATVEPTVVLPADFAEHFDFVDQEELELGALDEALHTPFRRAMQEGRKNIQRKEYEAAEQAYRRAHEMSRNSQAAKIGLANALFFLERYAESDALVKAVLDRDAMNPRALLLRADLLRARAKSGKAKEAYERVLRLAPQSRQAAMAKKILAEW